MGHLDTAGHYHETDQPFRNKIEQHTDPIEINPYDRGVLDVLKIVQDYWDEPEGYSELIDKIMKLIDNPPDGGKNG